MKEIKCKNLSELEQSVADIRRLVKEKTDSRSGRSPAFLFRGHSDSNWQLQTTLERFSDNEWLISEYNQLLARVHPNIVAHTDKSWGFVFKEKDLYFTEDHLNSVPNYNFMAYCRHHGFPSPLLDWTRSLYIALVLLTKKLKVRISQYISI